MILRKNIKGYYTFPKINRCLLDACNIYRVILYNRMSEDTYVMRVRDRSSDNPLRFCFYIEVPECIANGEYTYYVINDDEFTAETLNRNFIGNSKLVADKNAICFGGKFLLDSCGRILVTNKFNASIVVGDCELEDPCTGDIILSNYESDDKRAAGDIVTRISVLSCGVLKILDMDTYDYEDMLIKSGHKKEYETFK